MSRVAARLGMKGKRPARERGDGAGQPRPRRRGEGQWALGYREPLNKNEENKKNDDGLNVRLKGGLSRGVPVSSYGRRRHHP